MIKAKQEDKALIVALLEKSFKENRSVNFIVRQGRNKENNIRGLMDYAFEMCLIFGEVWLSDDRKACLLLIYPDRKRTTLASLWLDMKLVIRATGLEGALNALRREALIKKLQPKIAMAYLWFIGVDPLYQHKGIGSRLLKEAIAMSDNKNLPVYLETSTSMNLPWYDAMGFEIYNTLELGYTLFFLKHEPTH